MKKVISAFAIFLVIIILFIAGYDWHAVSAAHERLLADNNRLQTLNYDLKRENHRLLRSEFQLKELDDRIKSIRARGYRPDTLLVRQYQLLSDKFPSICNTSIDTFTMKESSYRHGRTGIFGEVGALQIMPETLKYFIYSLGGDTANFKIEDYSDLVTTTEWAYVIMFHLKWKKRELNWRDWNRGW